MIRRLILLAALVTAVLHVHAHDEVIPKPKFLQNGIPATELAGHVGENLIFKISIPAGLDKIQFKTSGGEGDVDLYVRRGVYPSIETNDGKSLNSGNTESITITNPASGPWYILVVGFIDYSGVQLTASYTVPASVVATPVLSPVPGVYASSVSVQMTCATANATIRYTTNGSAPTRSSPVFSSITISKTTHLRARAYTSSAQSAEVDVYYVIQPAGTVTTMPKDRPLLHRCGKAGSQHLFKISVPANTLALTIFTQGGPGDTELYVRRGALPTTTVFTNHVNGTGNSATFKLNTPATGDWYVLLRGKSTFSGVTIYGAARASKADLIVWPDVIEPYVSTETFNAEDCEVVEGMIGAGTHKLLRFNTETRNIGGKDLLVPPSEGPERVFEAEDSHPVAKGASIDVVSDPEASGGKWVSLLADGIGDSVQYTLPNVPKGTYAVKLTYKINNNRGTMQATIGGANLGEPVDQYKAAPFYRKSEILGPYIQTQDGNLVIHLTVTGKVDDSTGYTISADSFAIAPINPNFEFATCHGHYHFKGFASYRLLDANGQAVALGRKVSFCLEDIARWDLLGKPDVNYSCEDQGIQTGWADVYDSGLPGQWIDITDVPSGKYKLEITLNPQHILGEADYTNDEAAIDVVIE